MIKEGFAVFLLVLVVVEAVVEGINCVGGVDVVVEVWLLDVNGYALGTLMTVAGPFVPAM